MVLAENFDPRPLHVRVVEALANFPNGASTKELAAVLGDSLGSISAVVSKMNCYRGKVEKIGGTYGQNVKWRLRR